MSLDGALFSQSSSFPFNFKGQLSSCTRGYDYGMVLIGLIPRNIFIGMAYKGLWRGLPLYQSSSYSLLADSERIWDLFVHSTRQAVLALLMKYSVEDVWLFKHSKDVSLEVEKCLEIAFGYFPAKDIIFPCFKNVSRIHG